MQPGAGAELFLSPAKEKQTGCAGRTALFAGSRYFPFYFAGKFLFSFRYPLDIFGKCCIIKIKRLIFAERYL